MRWRRTVQERMQERLVQLGLSACPVCGGGHLTVSRLPTIEHIGGLPYKPTDPLFDPEATVNFLVHVECDICGHVVLFNSGRLEPSSVGSFIKGLTEEEEAALEREGELG